MDQGGGSLVEASAVGSAENIDQIQERDAKRARVGPQHGDEGGGAADMTGVEVGSIKKEEEEGGSKEGLASAHERGGPPIPSSSLVSMPPPSLPLHGSPSGGARVKSEALGSQGGSFASLAAAAGGMASPPPPPLTPDDPLKPGSYTLREQHLMKQEAEGEITFVYVENDGSAQNIIYLTGLKNIYAKQLPNMPKEYICRLVYDRRHKSAALIKRSGQVIGGITYRAFPEQRMGEVAFCAITSSEQVKGYGTRLMNQTKEFARTRDQLTHLVTYADNAAVGYFSKQGFTKEITLDKERWHGWIKDYDGGTLMECVVNPKICYTMFPELIRTQRVALDNKIRTVSKAHLVHKGLTYFKEPVTGGGANTGKASQAQVLPPVKPPLDIVSIEGVLEAGRTPDQAPTARSLLVFKEGIVESNPETLHRLMMQAWKELRENPDSWPFHAPVSPQAVPDYLVVIKDPIDLSLIESRIKSHRYYLALEIFVADVKRIFTNCRIYNNSETIYYKLANKLEAQFNAFLAAHVLSDDKALAGGGGGGIPGGGEVPALPLASVEPRRGPQRESRYWPSAQEEKNGGG